MRFSRPAEVGETGLPLWIGATISDVRVGFSHTARHITHSIVPNVDVKHDKRIAELHHVGQLSRVSWIEGFHQVLRGTMAAAIPMLPMAGWRWASSVCSEHSRSEAVGAAHLPS